MIERLTNEPLLGAAQYTNEKELIWSRFEAGALKMMIA
jgi:hypothetical protein